jgi:hypothetical protein
VFYFDYFRPAARQAVVLRLFDFQAPRRNSALITSPGKSPCVEYICARHVLAAGAMQLIDF